MRHTSKNYTYLNKGLYLALKVTLYYEFKNSNDKVRCFIVKSGLLEVSSFNFCRRHELVAAETVTISSAFLKVNKFLRTFFQSLLQ